jgi:O-antigen ligase
VLSFSVAACQHYGIWPSAAFFARLGHSKIPFYRMYEPAPGSPGHFMAGGLLLHRLKFAHVEGLVTLWALGAGLRLTGARRVLMLMPALLGLGAIWAFSYARAASLALTVCALVTLVWLVRRRGAYLLAAGLALAAGLFLLGMPSHRARLLASAQAGSNGNRTELLAAGIRGIEAHPWTGFGLGRFRPSKVPVPDMSANVREHTGKAHNEFVSMAAETGILGGVLFCALLVWLWRQCRGTPWGRMGRVTLLFFGLLSLAHDPLFHAEFSMALMLALGMGLSTEVPSTGLDEPAAAQPP